MSSNAAVIICIQSFWHYYSAKYEYIIRPTIRTEWNTNRILGTALFETLFPNSLKASQIAHF